MLVAMSAHSDRSPLPSPQAGAPGARERGADAASGAEGGRARELHVCRECSSPLVMPRTWEQAGPRVWAITLECPNCGWHGSGVFPEHAVERFDEELDRGTETLVRDLKTLIRANMEEQVERFAEALQAGLILPEDF